MVIKFWGTRGSIPVPGKTTVIFGGNTPCIEIKSSECYLILDGGSGLREAGNRIFREKTYRDIHILLSHYHWDHIQGIPFFKPLYSKDFRITFYGLSNGGKSTESILRSQMEPKNFPIRINEVSAALKFRNVVQGRKLNIGNLEIATYAANHPSPTIIYKFNFGGKIFIYMTDNELKQDQSVRSTAYKRLLKFCNGCDYLVHDAMFDEEAEIKSRGWGHSSNISLANLAREAKVKNIILFHYNPDYSDKKINFLYKETIRYFNENNSSIKCIAAREGLELEI